MKQQVLRLNSTGRLQFGAKAAPPPAEPEGIYCYCGKGRRKYLAAERTCRRAGPNSGRKFFVCSAGVCKFFEWA